MAPFGLKSGKGGRVIPPVAYPTRPYPTLPDPTLPCPTLPDPTGRWASRGAGAPADSWTPGKSTGPTRPRVGSPTRVLRGRHSTADWPTRRGSNTVLHIIACARRHQSARAIRGSRQSPPPPPPALPPAPVGPRWRKNRAASA